MLEKFFDRCLRVGLGADLNVAFVAGAGVDNCDEVLVSMANGSGRWAAGVKKECLSLCVVVRRSLVGGLDGLCLFHMCYMRSPSARECRG